MPEELGPVLKGTDDPLEYELVPAVVGIERVLGGTTGLPGVEEVALDAGPVDGVIVTVIK